MAREALSRHTMDSDEAEVFRVAGLAAWRKAVYAEETDSPVSLLRKALGIAMEQGAASWRLSCAISLGQYLFEHGKPIEARELVGAARTAIQEGTELPAQSAADELLALN